MGPIFIFIRWGGVLGNNQKISCKGKSKKNLSAPNLIRKRYHTMQTNSRKTLKNRIGVCNTFLGDIEMGSNRSYAFSFLSAQSTAIKYHSREPNQFNKYSHFLGTSSSRISTRSTCRLSCDVSSCFYWRPACGF